MKRPLMAAIALALGLVLFAPAMAFSQGSDPCNAPTVGTTAIPVGIATGCGVIITIPASGPATVSFPNQESGSNGNPYDDSDDTLVGIINNSGASVSSITLMFTSEDDSFGFDGDGPCQYASVIAGTNAVINTNDCFPLASFPANYTPTGYEGPDNTFSGYGPTTTASTITTAEGNTLTEAAAVTTTGTVNFITPIPSGGSTWFALEGPPSSLTGVTLAPILTVTELGTGIGTVTDGGQINCTEANGIQQPGSNCTTGTYTSGATVTLWATANSSEGTSITPNPETPSNGSTFLGWISGPCAGTTTSPCSFTIRSSQTVTADFAPNPTPVPFTINTGTNVIAQAEYACPSETSPCTDPNAYGFSLQFPVVSESFQYPLNIVATEVYADGICPYGQVPDYGQGFPTGPTTDFDCRFVYTFNYGTTDSEGDTVVPLCDAYANGNCVHFDVYYGTTADGFGPGSPPPSVDFTGPLFETFSFSNSTVSPGSYWANSTTRAIIDPDVAGEASSSPSAPYGTSCSTPMQIGTPPAQYSPEIYCQFDADITAFIDTGGTSKNISDFVVAFQPTSAPLYTTSTSTPIPSNEIPTIAGSCLTNGCTVGSDPSSAPIPLTFTEGTGGTFQVSVPAPGSPTPYPAPNLTAYTTGTTTLVLPNGLTYNGSTGVVSGTPAYGTAGSYPVTFTATNSQGSATLSYTLTVNPAGTLNITASSPSITYGQVVPPITASYSGLLNGDLAPATLPTCSVTGAAVGTVANAGTYATSCLNAVDGNYSLITYTSGTLTVKPATTLIIAASSGTMTYGGTVPTITATSVTGFAGTDTIASLGAITCSTTATSASPVIASPYYPSSCLGAVDANYFPITYVSGAVQVIPAPLTITANNQSKNYGATLTLGTTAFSTSPLYNGNTVTGVTLTSAGAAAAAAPGTYSIVPSAAVGTGLGNYSPINYVNGTLTVSALEITPLNAFGTVYLNGVGVQLITITNKGTTGFTISGLSITAPGNALADYGTADITLCPPMIERLPATLPGGKSCTIGVGIHPTVATFSPTASTATLMIADTAAGNPHSFALTALVINPLATFSSTHLSSGKLTFPTTTKGNSNEQTITVTNTGNTPLTLGNPAISISGGDFTLTSTTCTNAMTIYTAAEGGVTSCAISVTFTPKAAGTFAGTLTINDNANPTVEKNPQTITLSGTT